MSVFEVVLLGIVNLVVKHYENDLVHYLVVVELFERGYKQEGFFVVLLVFWL